MKFIRISKGRSFVSAGSVPKDLKVHGIIKQRGRRCELHTKTLYLVYNLYKSTTNRSEHSHCWQHQTLFCSPLSPD